MFKPNLVLRKVINQLAEFLGIYWIHILLSSVFETFYDPLIVFTCCFLNEFFPQMLYTEVFQRLLIHVSLMV